MLHQDVAELQQQLLAVPHFQRIRQPEVAGAALDVQPQRAAGGRRPARLPALDGVVDAGGGEPQHRIDVHVYPARRRRRARARAAPPVWCGRREAR